MIWLIATTLITVHMIDGRVVQINPQQVTQLLSTRSEGNRALPDAVQCVIRLTDGGFVSVAEDCETVRKLMEGGP